MTEEEILEGGRLIAEFMGLKWKSFNGKYNIFLVPEDEQLKYKAIHIGGNNLLYHSSWDRLMPVVEKINRTGKFDVIIYRSCAHVNDEHQLLFETSHEVSKNGNFILCVWEPIVQFIKWYNNEKDRSGNSL